jgi:hypothetical protein
VSRSHLAAALLALTACGARPVPHRFSSPMLGAASVPAPLPRVTPPDEDHELANRRAETIHVEAAPRIREVSMNPVSTNVPEQLPAPNRDKAPLPTILAPADLRTYIGRRDPRDPIAAVRGWAYDLGTTIDGDIVAWAEHDDRLREASTPPERGDLLVFDKVTSDDDADLIGIVVARDERNVTEFVYLGEGIVRRGFVDVTRPKTKRDKAGAVVNTFLRHTKRWPNKGSHYLAGEHLQHVIQLTKP